MSDPGRTPRGRVRVAMLIASSLLAVPAIALAANPNFPGSDPYESPRINTPDDPGFDECELDDPDTPPPPADCDSYFEEEFGAFGFSPDSANENPLPHSAGGATQYDDCSQLDPQGREANTDAGDPDCSQLSGVRADTAWKYSIGDPGVAIAILDTGIRWQDTELVNKVRLNKGELPVPQAAGGAPCAAPGPDPYDCNGDGAFDIRDYSADPRVSATDGDQEADGIRDASDLIAVFSQPPFRGDGDGNGYVDDIAGWDFFDDDNDPFDASSCCNAGGHGTGRAREAAAETNNSRSGTGMCPRCQIIPLRVWDTFVVPTDNYAMGVLYAARNGATVVEGAVGGLSNSLFAREAFRYADQQGLALTLVSSDINSANHNYPTNYNEAIYVGGSFPDTAPNNTCSVPGIPGVDFPIDPGPEFEEGCQEFLGLLNSFLGITPSAQPITTSFFRNSNLTQYGGKADIVLMGSTGSINTGQAAGAAGLLASFGRETFGGPSPLPDTLSGNEIRQLLTMTAEDVRGNFDRPPDQSNTGTIGLPDRADLGWDPHFGYGRVNLAAAMARIANDRGPRPQNSSGSNPPFEWPCDDADDACVPPEAQIDSPAWFAPINVDRVSAAGVPIRGRATAPHGDGVGAWEVEYACGQDALDSSFQPIPGASGTGPVPPGGLLGTIPKPLLESLADTCNGEVENDAGRPAGSPADGAWPADPYPDPDPERHAFQIRLTVHEADDPENVGRYRKTLHAYRDDGNLPAWPRPVGTGSDAPNYVTGSGGETSPRLFDVDGDNELDVVLGTSSGELHVLNADGTPVESFNGGQPVTADRYRIEQGHPGAVPVAVPTPREALRVPAIGDIDGDLEPEIVAIGGEHVYAWETDGSRVDGFDPPPGVDPALSDPCKPGAPHPCFNTNDRAITEANHIKRGFIGSAALADLAPSRPGLEIVAGALDQHLYAWDGDGGTLPGFPVYLRPRADGAPIPCGDDDFACAEIVTSPAIAQLDGAGPPEIVIATNEVIPGEPDFPGSLFEFFGDLVGAGTGFNPVYAVYADGTTHPGDPDGVLPGWPVTTPIGAGDLLPLVIPGHDAAVIDADEDGDDEVSVSAATSITPGGARLVDGDGSSIREYQAAPAQSPDQGPVINLADYAAIGDLLGTGNPAVVKGGFTANGAVNLLALNQNLPFSHVEQAWDVASGEPLPGYPRPTEDLQLLSQAAIARVGGPAPLHQALVGTGLYNLHAYGPGGVDAAGWPKFTGGWIQTTPAVGDADGDGDLDVSVVTREGWSFLWSTGVPACGGSNDEWWSFHHDEHGTANYGHDGRPPGTPTELAATLHPGGVELRWEAPGDDWLCGTASRIRVIASNSPIEHPSDGALVKEVDAAAAAGQTETLSLTAAEHASRRYVAVLYRDEAANWGRLAAIDLAAPGPGPGGGLADGPCANAKRGTARRDVLRGTAKGDGLRSLGGNDTVLAFGDADCVAAGRGADTANGAAGNDRLNGQRGADRLRGGSGRDRIAGNGGRDRLKGGAGRDRIRGGLDNDRLFARDGSRDTVDCGPGRRDRAVVDRRDKVSRCERVGTG